MANKKNKRVDNSFARSKPTKQEMIVTLSNIVTHPEFVKLVKEIESQATPERRIEYARNYSTLKELRKRGIDIPDGLRICLRQFENTGEPSTEFDLIHIEGPTIPQTGTWTICVSYGVALCISFGYSWGDITVRNDQKIYF